MAKTSQQTFGPNVLFLRKNNQIKDLKGDTVKDYKTINEAKRVSKKLQLDNDGAIGKGCLRVVTRFPGEPLHPTKPRQKKKIQYKKRKSDRLEKKKNKKAA